MYTRFWGAHSGLGSVGGLLRPMAYGGWGLGFYRVIYGVCRVYRVYRF